MSHKFVVAPLVALALIAVIPHSAAAQEAERSRPVAIPVVSDIPAAQDVPYPGTIRLEVDARDLARGVFKARQTVPVIPGTRELVLLSPEWLPGKHAPRPQTRFLTDVSFSVAGKPVSWARDPVDVNAFRVALPEGAKDVVASFAFASPLQTSEGRIVMTQEMMNLQFDAMSLYPAGHYVRQIKVKPEVRFPDGWSVFTALDGQALRQGVTTWDVTDYETLVDSPIFAGKHAQRWDLGHDIYLDAVADDPKYLAIKPEHLATYRKLADEALALFGTAHFDHYDFLLALTDRMGDIGLEHQRSSENAYDPTDFIEWDKKAFDRNVVPHELVHSWNGKYRRPERMWTPDFRQPMLGDMLWMYEGQTQFWGYVLAARSGVQPKDVVLGAIATAAGYRSEAEGREWRSIDDTTRDPILNARKPLPYTSLSRSEDYYWEGALVWLEADQIIRRGTGGARGLDDFARAFFGVKPGDLGQLTYDYEDIVAALNAVHPYDWAGFLDARFAQPGRPAPVEGIEMAGYRLVWKDTPNPYSKGLDDKSGDLDLKYSLGFELDKDGKVKNPMWDSPGVDAGIVTGAQIVAINGEAWSKDGMKDAITAAKGGKEPIELLVKRGTRYLTVPVKWNGGMRYPWLEPVGEGEQPFDRLLAPRT
ncbi:M61 family metallopeptidase [Tsuneonella sp. HG222]